MNDISKLKFKISDTSSFDTDGLLDYVISWKPDINWQCIVVNFEQYTLKEHTRHVLESYVKYFESEPLPLNFDKGIFKLILAMHDIGKPAAIKAGDKYLQHEMTVPLMEAFFRQHDVDEVHTRTALALVSNDPIGSYLQGHIDHIQSGQIIRRMAADARVDNVVDFFSLMMIYYVTDAGSYPYLRQTLFSNYEAGVRGFKGSVMEKIRKLNFDME